MKLNDLLTQHACVMTPLPQAERPGRRLHRTAQQRYGLPLLGALVCLLLVVGTSQAYWVTLGPYAFTRLCPEHITGDREYAGHGPEVFARAELHMSSDWTTLYVVPTMLQRETQSDWSRASLQEWIWLYNTPAGQVIRFIWNATRSEIHYIDTDHALDRFVPTDTLVQEFQIMGDTSGNDIGNCTTGDAYLSVYLDTIWLWVE
jgi:hypothetical protein